MLVIIDVEVPAQLLHILIDAQSIGLLHPQLFVLEVTSVLLSLLARSLVLDKHALQLISGDYVVILRVRPLGRLLWLEALGGEPLDGISGVTGVEVCNFLPDGDDLRAELPVDVLELGVCGGQEGRNLVFRLRRVMDLSSCDKSSCPEGKGQR